MFFITSCKNPSVVEQANPGSVSGKDPIGDNPTPDPTPTPPPPRPQRIVIELEGRRTNSDDLDGLRIPYKKGLVKTISLGDNRKGKWCADNYKDQCVKNRQVQFSFDLDEIPYLLDGQYRVVKSEVQGSFYSIGKNYKTELICLLNIKKCSGRSIIRIPKLGLSFLIKMLWWDKKFWKEGHDSVVANDWFHTQMMGTWNDDEKLFLMEDWSFRMSSLFNLHNDELNEVFKSERPLVFTVTDDTYVESPKIKLTLEEVL